MFSQLQRTRTRLQQVADGALLMCALLASYYLRAHFPWLELHPLESIENYLWVAPLFFFLGPAVLAWQGFYQPPRAGQRRTAVLIILRSCTFTVLGAIFFLFLFRLQLARSVVILTGALGGALIYFRHEVSRWSDGRAFVQAQLRRRALWVGIPEENARLRASLSTVERAGLIDCGNFDPVREPLARFTAVMHRNTANVIILNLAGLDAAQLLPLLDSASQEGVEVLIRPGLGPLATPRLVLDQLAGEAVFSYQAQAPRPLHQAIKQGFDYLAAVLLLVVLSPLILLVALAVRLSSPGPILYRQLRAGLNGSRFLMLKFRSMFADAESRHAELAAQNEMRGPVFKMASDPRVTSLGKFLRRHSLDELPQLWNVLRGEMSLVGPRPLPVEEVERIANNSHRRRLSVKPGLTCLWQIHGRNDIADFNDWVRLDLAYIDQWSLWLDLKILIATIPVALFGRGAR